MGFFLKGKHHHWAVLSRTCIAVLQQPNPISGKKRYKLCFFPKRKTSSLSCLFQTLYRSITTGSVYVLSPLSVLLYCTQASYFPASLCLHIKPCRRASVPRVFHRQRQGKSWCDPWGWASLPPDASLRRNTEDGQRSSNHHSFKMPSSFTKMETDEIPSYETGSFDKPQARLLLSFHPRLSPGRLTWPQCFLQNFIFSGGCCNYVSSPIRIP